MPTDIDQRPILIVDPSEDARGVLRTALQRRGHQALVAADSEEGLRLAREHRPGVIVVDVESRDDNGGSPNDLPGPKFAAHARIDDSSLVLLGTARRQARQFAAGQFVQKPYHYGPLIRQIEQLLTAEPTSAARAA